MKNLLILFGTFLCFGSAIAQTSPLDRQLQNVNQSTVTSGIIYNRSTPLADLCVYNMPADEPHNTADFRFFKQALFELHKASNHTKLISVEQLQQRVNAYSEMNVVPIGIINTPFQVLNYNPENPNEGGLTFRDSLFTQISGKEPFLNGYTLIVSPLKNVMQGEIIIYKFSQDLIFNNGNTPIKSLIADFGDGIPQHIIENGILVNREIIIVNNKSNGDKKLNFTVTLVNDFTFDTNATIYTVQGNYTFNGLNVQPIACSTELQNTGLVKNFDVDYIQATENFQGLNENVGFKGKIEPRVFYHTNGGNTQELLLKPIIIVDGFDPSDTRRIDDCDCERDPKCQEYYKDKKTGIYNPGNHKSFVELMKYLDGNNEPQNLINVLRTKGYDVIIVNQPSYKVNGVTIDGGADFIERNGKAFVQLIKEVNAKLVVNGSTEKLVVLGPSMGGQITRYALAYMEKKFAETGDATWQHNTRIWVAFDSPNLGANVPIGAQSLIASLGSDSPEAQESFKKLQTIAANEMLVNYFKANPPYSTFPYIPNNNLDNSFSNGSTTSQGMPTNAGNAYFKEHYNNQFQNGLPNSNGYPMNLRKLAIVNGSLSGETFGNGYEKMLDLRLVKRVCLFNWTIFGGWSPSSCFSSKLFEAEARTMPTSNSRVSHKWKFAEGSIDYNASANSVRGNMDNVPGGSIDAIGILHESITGAPGPGPRSFWQYTIGSLGSFYYNHIGSAPKWTTTVLKPNQCFIPTFSSMGIKNPNQSWANPLNRNLVCSNETYFDSYFGEANNTEHVALNYRSVAWLLKELGSNTSAPSPQVPSFPISTNDLSGASMVCSTATYSFGDICKVPSDATWTKSSNLQITSSNGFSVNVSKTTYGYGEGYIKATFQNGTTVTKNVWVGVPIFNNLSPVGNQSSYNPNEPSISVSVGSDACNQIRLKANFDSPSILEYQWEKITTDVTWGVNASSGDISLMPQCNKNFIFKVRARNICGWSDWKQLEYYMNRCTIDCSTTPPNNGVVGNNFILSPNPVTNNSMLDIAIKNTSPWFYPPATIDPNTGLPIPPPLTIKKVNISIYGSSMNLLQSYTNKTVPTQLDISTLPQGSYLVIFEHFGLFENYTIIKGL